MRRRRHLLWWFGAFVLSSVIFLLATDIGLIWSVYAINRFFPVVHISNAQGRWLGPLKIDKVSYHGANIDIDIENIRLHWNPWYLIKEIHVDELSVGRIQVAMQPTLSKVHEPIPLDLYLKAPMNHRVVKASLHELVILRRGHRVAFNDVRLAARQRGKQLHLDRVGFRLLDIVFSGRGAAQLTSGVPLDVETRWLYARPGSVQVNGQGRVWGDMQKLQLEQDVDQHVVGHVTGSVEDVLGAIHWQLDLQANQAVLRAVHPGIPVDGTQGHVRHTGDPQTQRFTGQLKLVSNEFGSFTTDIDATYTDAQWTFNSARVQSELQPEALLEAQGRIGMDKRFQFNAHWRQWRTAPWLPVDLKSDSGETQGEGDTQAMRFNGKMWLEGLTVPKGEWEIQASTDYQSMQIDEVKADVMQGKLLGRGRLRWRPALSWDGEVRTEKINPAGWSVDWPGKLTAHILSQGDWSATQPLLAVQIKQLQGTLRKQNVSGTGKLLFKDNITFFDQFAVTFGKAAVEVNGDLGQTWSLRWSARMPDLSLLLPKAKGNFNLTGQMQGELETPILRAKAQVHGVKIDTFSIQNLDSDIDLTFNKSMNRVLQAGILSTLDHIKQAQIRVSGQTMQWGENAIRQFDMALLGNNTDHRVSLEAKSDFANLMMQMQGRAQNQGWQEQLERAEIALPAFGLWSLGSPAKVSIHPTKLQVEPFCLQQRGMRSCQSAEWSAAGWQLQGELKKFPVSLLSAWLPKNLELSTELAQLDWSARLQPAQPPMVTGELQTGDGQITYTLPTGDVVSMSHTPSQMDFRLEKGAFSGSAVLQLHQGNVVSDFQIPLSPQAAKPFLVDVKVRLAELQELFALAPFLEKTQGNYQGQFQLSGDMKRPSIRVVQSQLKNGETFLRRAGLSLTDVQINTQTEDQNKLSFNGGLRSIGALKLDGDLRQQQGAWLVNGKIQGKNVQIFNTDEYQLVVSPDLVVQTQDHLLSVNGKVDIPRARFQPKDISIAVTTSTDEVVIGAQAAQVQPKPTKIAGSIELEFGNNVSFKLATMGTEIEGNITGDLRVTEKPGFPTLANGELNIEDGKVLAYGQKLTIESGRFNFRGGPIDTPALDITALTDIEDARVGVRVRGSWPRIQLLLISEPPMNETEILSYLIMGQPVDQLTQKENQDFSKQVALFLGGQFASQFGKSIGLDEVSLKAKDQPYVSDTTGNNGQTQQVSIQVGKYLSPKLYVGYGIGLYERAHSVNIRYKIRKGLSFEASSGQTTTGQTSSGDLLLTIEKNRVVDEKPKDSQP